MLRKENGDELWRNAAPSSIQLCRPVKIEFIKESDVVIRREKENLYTEIESLQELIIPGFTINYKISLTMIDGKVS